MTDIQEAHTVLSIDTNGPSFIDVTGRISAWLTEVEAGDGQLAVFIRHTSASLVIQENADPDVTADLKDVLDEIAPENRRWRHKMEGPDDMPAHVKAMMTATSLTIPVIGGTATFGTWQAVYVVEHRRAPHRRQVVLSYLGTRAGSGG